MIASAKGIERTKILTKNEIRTIISDLSARKSAPNTHQNLIIFRLATCCGLRVSEIVGITLDDVQSGCEFPHINIRSEVGKGGKARIVPLWWDAETLRDIHEWKLKQEQRGVSQFVCSLSKGTYGKPLSRRNAQYRWSRALKCIGPARQKRLSIHKGRHTFCSISLAGGRQLPEVRDAAGHCNISITSRYLHAVDDDGAVGNLFDF